MYVYSLNVSYKLSRESLLVSGAPVEKDWYTNWRYDMTIALNLKVKKPIKSGVTPECKKFRATRKAVVCFEVYTELHEDGANSENDS
jgi:hypothetical protein